MNAPKNFTSILSRLNLKDHCIWKNFFKSSIPKIKRYDILVLQRCQAWQSIITFA